MGADSKTKEPEPAEAPAGEVITEALEPLAPEKKFNYRFRSGRDRTYYKSIPWPALWDEFNSAIDKNGRRKYRTAWGFICAKTRIHWQRTVLWEMIGPEPTTAGDNEFLRVPYLGNWEQRRKNGFYVFEDLTKAKAVQEALKHRHGLQETSRALAPLIAKRMAFWYQVRDQITEGYAGKIFEDNKPVAGAQQKTRVDAFLKWQQSVERTILRLEEQWMRIHGVDPQDPAQQWITAAALGGKVGANVQTQVSSGPVLILDGEELPLPENISYDAILLAYHLRAHAETFGLPLPEDEEKAEKPKPTGSRKIESRRRLSVNRVNSTLRTVETSPLSSRTPSSIPVRSSQLPVCGVCGTKPSRIVGCACLIDN